MEWIIGLLTLIVTVLIAVFSAQSSRVTMLSSQCTKDKDAMVLLIAGEKDALQKAIAVEKDDRQKQQAIDQKALSDLRHEMTSHYVTADRLRETLELSMQPMSMLLQRIEQDMQKIMRIQEAVAVLTTKMEQRE